jgi:hypothetical protein
MNVRRHRRIPGGRLGALELSHEGLFLGGQDTLPPPNLVSFGGDRDVLVEDGLHRGGPPAGSGAGPPEHSLRPGLGQLSIAEGAIVGAPGPLEPSLDRGDLAAHALERAANSRRLIAGRRPIPAHGDHPGAASLGVQALQVGGGRQGREGRLGRAAAVDLRAPGELGALGVDDGVRDGAGSGEQKDELREHRRPLYWWRRLPPGCLST